MFRTIHHFAYPNNPHSYLEATTYSEASHEAAARAEGKRALSLHAEVDGLNYVDGWTDEVPGVSEQRAPVFRRRAVTA